MSTLAALRTRVRERCDMVNSDFISDSELLTFINESYAELYDILIASYEDYFTIQTDLTLSDGSGSLDLPSDFYKLRGVDYQDGSEYRELYRFNFNERNNNDRRNLLGGAVRYRIVKNALKLTPADQANGNYRLWYMPQVTQLADDADTVDVPTGFDEYIVIDAAIKCLVKEESSTTALDKAKEAMLGRIESMSVNRDTDQPDTISDVNDTFYW